MSPNEQSPSPNTQPHADGRETDVERAEHVKFLSETDADLAEAQERIARARARLAAADAKYRARLNLPPASNHGAHR